MDPIACREASFCEHRLDVGDGARLRVFEWRPRQAVDDLTVFFVAGWVSAVQGWSELLRALAARRRVVYLETREKPSAELAPAAMAKSRFGIEQMARDLVVAAAALELVPERTVLMGSSLGATGLLEAQKGGRLGARAAFLISPNARFRIPRLGVPLLYLPACLYHVLKHPIIWYLDTFRVDAAREPEQMQRYRATLLAAEPLRLKLSAQAVRGYQVWSGLDGVTVPVALAYAESDRLHAQGDVARLCQALPRAVAVRCPSNKHMHSAALLGELEHFLAQA